MAEKMDQPLVEARISGCTLIRWSARLFLQPAGWRRSCGSRPWTERSLISKPKHPAAPSTRPAMDEKALQAAMEATTTAGQRGDLRSAPVSRVVLEAAIAAYLDAMTAPAEMPGVEEVARAICNATGEFNWDDENESVRSQFRKEAVAALALFAPILAEKERLEAANAKRKEFGKWLDDLAENPPPPSEALKKLFADYKASGIKSVGLDSPFNACCYREHCKALEARALAAEAALAAERERCAKIAEAHDKLPCRSLLEGQRGEDYDCGQIDAATSIAAAIRAEGE